MIYRAVALRGVRSLPPPHEIFDSPLLKTRNLNRFRPFVHRTFSLMYAATRRIVSWKRWNGFWNSSPISFIQNRKERMREETREVFFIFTSNKYSK